jgi:hypothetical protein
MEEPVAALITWLAERLEIPASAFADYSNPVRTVSDHARMLTAAPGLRPAAATDLPFMIEAAAKAAWGTDRGLPAATGVVAALRAGKVIPPIWV